LKKMKTKHVIVSVVIAFIAGLLIGEQIGVRQARRFVDQLRAELIPDHRAKSDKDKVNIPAALDQVRTCAQRLGVKISDVAALDAHTVQFRIGDGPEVRFQWEDMGEDTARSHQELDRKFRTLSIALEKANEVRAPVKNVDLTE
jgi:hypothetical protein